MDNKAKVEFLERAMQKLMGKVLDMGRLTEMGDRAFIQFERSTKIEFNSLSRLFKEQFFGVVDEVRKEPKEGE
jgi:hypothetical protein